MSSGRFITLEGIEGAGKSTLVVGARRAHRASRGDRGAGHPRARRHAAGREKLRSLLRGTESISAEAETLLMFAARCIHLDNLVRPALARGEWVLCDRFTDATRAYQGGGRGVDAGWIESLAQAVHGGLEPDLTLLLDLPVETGLARARTPPRQPAHAATDRFESETLAFFERVRRRYLDIATASPLPRARD